MATANVIIQCLVILYNTGVFTTILAPKNVVSDNDNCVMSFVIPRDKIKNSCQMDEKVKRRLNVLEAKLNMYKEEVAKFQTHLYKERQLCHERIDVLEGKISTIDAGERYFAMEKKLQNLEIVLKKGSDGFVPLEKVVGNRQSNHAKSAYKKGDWSHNGNLESVVKPIVISEIENYLENFTIIAGNKKKASKIVNNAIMDSWLRNDQSYVDEPDIDNGSKLHDMTNEIELLETKLNQTGDELLKTLGKYLKNVTIKTVKNVQNITYLEYSGDGDNETETNFTENSNSNTNTPTEATEIPVKESKASMRIAITEGGDETQRDQEQESSDFEEVNLYTDELEEILRGEINSLLQSRMEEVVSLMRKQSATLVSVVDQQGKELEDMEDSHEERMKRLQDTVSGMKLEVSSLSQAVQEFYTKLERIRGSQISMEEIKKNMTSFLPHRDQEMISKVDELGKNFRTLNRLYDILRQSLQHYRNKSKVAYTEVQSKLYNLETTLARDVSSELYWNITTKFNRELEHYNESTTARLISMDADILNLDDNSVLCQMDIKNLERRHKSKTGKLEEDSGNLKNRVDRINNQNRKLQENVNMLKTKQHTIQTQTNTTKIALKNLQIEFKLSMTETWVEYDFDYDTSKTECFGKQYIRQTKYRNGRLTGVVLCSNLRYKIMLANSVTDKFNNIGDVKGFGEDHCEFVGAKHSSIIHLSPPAISMKTEEGFARDHWGQEPKKVNLNFLRPSPAWYECGIPIP